MPHIYLKWRCLDLVMMMLAVHWSFENKQQHNDHREARLVELSPLHKQLTDLWPRLLPIHMEASPIEQLNNGKNWKDFQPELECRHCLRLKNLFSQQFQPPGHLRYSQKPRQRTLSLPASPEFLE